MKTNIKFAKTHPNAVFPSKRVEDAGFDLYPCFEEEYLRIEPHETIKIPTGIACACSPDFCVILKERSSTGSVGLAQRAGVIDSGYRGEILVPVTNTTYYPIVICKPGAMESSKDPRYKTIILPYTKAIAQMIVLPVPQVEVEEISYEELNHIPSERGIGGFGSSGK